MKRGLLVGDALLTGTPFHDELQVEVSDEWSHKVGHSFVEGIRQTGTYYDMRIRLDGEYAVFQRLMALSFQRSVSGIGRGVYSAPRWCNCRPIRVLCGSAMESAPAPQGSRVVDECRRVTLTPRPRLRAQAPRS
jgi:hypothetical protein